MAGKKISQLTALGSTYAATDLFEISKDMGGGTYASRKITGAELTSSISTSIAIGDTITSATEGSVLFAGAAGILAQDNANFFWDDTNNRLGLGTATPASTFDLSGDFNSSGTTFTVSATAGLSIAQMTGGGDLVINTGGGGSDIARIKLTDDVLSLEAGDWQTPDPNRARIILDGQSGGNGKIAILGGDLGTPAVGEVLTAKNTSGELEWAAAANPTQNFIIACSDETTALTTGTAKVTFRMPYAFTLTAVRASVTTAPVGSVLTVDINETGSTILSTKLTIDASEKTSTTAATPPVISVSALADDAEITIDIDTVGSTTAGAGLKVTLIGTKT
tara:strand:- start:2668 stop:3672 length:1005 start_codon:yes stop_codon:yes gene_type:complete